MKKTFFQKKFFFTSMVPLSTLIRNGFSAHPENFILAMLADDDEIICSQAVEIVLSIRKSRAGELI